MTTPNIGELAATTIENYSKTLADNVSTHNPLLNEVFLRGNKTPAAGGTKIRQELMYAQNGNFQWFTGLETLDVSGSDTMDAADYDWKEASVIVPFSGLDEAKNSGKEAIHSLIKSRVKVAEITMKNEIASSVFSDGTGSSGKELGGMQLLIADDPTTGTVGSIDRSAQTFWRNQVFDFSTEGLTAASASNIQQGMNTLWRRCERNGDVSSIVIMDDLFYGFYESSLQTIHRVTSDSTADAGFSSLMYKGKKVYYDSNCPASHMYFINLDYLFFRPHPKFDFMMDKENRAINQHAKVFPIFFKGNLTMSNASLQGVGKN